MDKLLIANSPFIKLFTISIIKTQVYKKLGNTKIEWINTSLIPETSQQVIASRMAPKRVVPDLAGIPRPHPDLSSVPLPTIELRGNFSLQAPKNYISSAQGEYGKLGALLKDDTITLIECDGADKMITITKANERQLTKISLTAKEIKDLMQKISAKSRIPLMDGVFKAQIDNFEVNAVISDIIGTKFILRKQTPYNLIEKKPQGIKINI